MHFLRGVYVDMYWISYRRELGFTRLTKTKGYLFTGDTDQLGLKPDSSGSGHTRYSTLSDRRVSRLPLAIGYGSGVVLGRF